MKKIARILTISFAVMLALSTLGVCYLYFHMVHNLPDIQTLKSVQLQVPMRLYSRDHQLIAQYGEKRRNPITLEEVPEDLIHAILATEDQRFFEHPGVDIWGLLRAAKIVFTSGNRSQGGSTITMQVARNFFLTRKKTYTRKLNEILLAIKIDSQLSKKKILELYLNKIYFGYRAYGVDAAAQVYFGKSLDQLSLAEMALLAGLPKAPSSLNPLASPDKALKRRNHVLARMLEQKYITEAQYEDATEAPIEASYHELANELDAPYVAELAREMVVTHYGKDSYDRGLQVFTTIDSHMQLQANRSVARAVINYDRRHGYHGREAHWQLPELPFDDDEQENLQQQLNQLSTIHGLKPVVIIAKHDSSIDVLTAEGKTITLDHTQLQYPATAKNPLERLKAGDVIRIQSYKNQYRLAQLPDVEGALIALDPNNGSVLAMTGGFNYQHSKFNRIVQAKRQPGSVLKPFIYSAALDNGVTLATLINDSPIVIGEEEQGNLWRPQNYSKEFFGPTRLREALVTSRNLVSVRILNRIGIDKAREHLAKFGFDPSMQPQSLSLALGAGEVTPLGLAAGYAVFANGGHRIVPFVIERILDSDGNVLFQAKPKTACPTCNSYFTSTLLTNMGNELPQAPPVISKQNAYLIHHVLQEVIQRGTARRAKQLSRGDLAGKTGTTNNQMDAWFSGYQPDLVVTTWMGYDQPRSLKEYAANTSLPMWIDFMKQALNNVPEKVIPQPAGIVAMRINKNTGYLAEADDPNSMFELFMGNDTPDAAPTQSQHATTLAAQPAPPRPQPAAPSGRMEHLLQKLF